MCMCVSMCVLVCVCDAPQEIGADAAPDVASAVETLPGRYWKLGYDAGGVAVYRQERQVVEGRCTTCCVKGLHMVSSILGPH